MESFEKQLKRAAVLTEKSGGGIMVVTEGVFGMAGDQGKLAEIVKFKKEYGFRLFVDDAHGFGTIGENGRGAGDYQGVHDEIDVYFGTFAKAMATIGAFVAGDEHVIEYLRYNMRSQTFAKSLPMPIVIGSNQAFGDDENGLKPQRKPLEHREFTSKRTHRSRIQHW